MPNQLHLWGDDTPGDRLRWSVSRYKRLRDCRRKYYLFHFASRGGQQPNAPRRLRELFVLRSLRTRHMWVGEIVHDMIELAMTAWRRNDEVPAEGLVERGIRTMRAQYAESLQGVYWDRPLQAVGLSEHEYKEDISREQWRERRDLMEQCLRNFYSLPLVETIRALPRWRWLAVENAGSFDLGGAVVMVRPDFAWRDEEDRVAIVDWKTGRPWPGDEDLQLAVYALFAQRTWGLGSDYMNAITAYLANGDVREWRIDQDALDGAEARISASVDEMRQLGAGVEELDRPEAMARFPMTDELELCGRCGFRRVCNRG